MTTNREKKNGQVNVRKSMVCAVRQGNVEAVRNLIDSFGLSYAKTWSGGYALLCDATRSNRREIVKLLLSNGCKVNAEQSTAANTPLHYAVTNADVEVVRLFLDRGADVNAQGIRRRTPLHCAVRDEQLDIVKVLCRFGANQLIADVKDMLPLHFAVRSTTVCLEIVEMLSYGGGVNRKSRLNDYAPIHFAVRSGNVEIVEFLLKCGADVDALANKNVTPLHVAVENNHLQIAEVLLSHGADINAMEVSGRTALSLAADGGHFTVVKLLLNYGYGAVVKMQKTWLYILLLALENDCEETVQHVLQEFSVENTKLATKSNVDVLNKFVECFYHCDVAVPSKDDGFIALLYTAVKKGHAKIVERFLSRGCVDAKDPAHSRTFLHTALRNKRPEVARRLIEFGTDDNDDTGLSLVCLAVANDDFKMTKLLLSYEVDKIELDMLLLAVQDDCDVVQRYGRTTSLMMGYDIDFNSIGRRKNFFNGKATGEIARLLLLRGADVNVRTENLDETPLHLAIMNLYDEKLIDVLIEFGADVNSMDDNLTTPLHCASRVGNTKVINVLLHHGANVNCVDNRGVTPLLYAVRYGVGRPVVSLLLDNGADVNLADQSGETPLHIAARYAKEKLVKMLLRRGANVNAVDNIGSIPLRISLEKGRTTITKLLLKVGAAHGYEESKRGQTLFHLAVSYSWPCVTDEFVEMLHGFGVDVDSKDDTGRTALHLAAESGHEGFTKLFLHHGCDVNATTSSGGQTALHLACQNGRSRIVRVLLENGADVNATCKFDRMTPLDYVKESAMDSWKRSLCHRSHRHGINENDDHPVACYGNHLRFEDYYHNMTFDGDEDLSELSDSLQLTKEILRRHAMKLMSAGFYLSESLDWDRCGPTRSRCKAEIERMRSAALYGDISFYDILVGNLESVAKFIKHDAVALAFASGDYKQTFPEYSSMLEHKFRQGLERLHLSLQSTKSFCRLPCLVTEKIFSYLSNADVKNLVLTSYVDKKYNKCKLFKHPKKTMG